MPVISDVKKNTSSAEQEQEPLLVTEKTFKQYLDKQVGDMHDKISYRERKEAIEAATEVFANGELKFEDLPLDQNKQPETYTERALKKLTQKGRFLMKK